jgi:hypothetical protein
LESNEHNEKHKSNREMDPFTRFMFGTRKSIETYKESENDLQEIREQKEPVSYHIRSNHNDDDWFFGRRRKEPLSWNQNRQKQPQHTQNTLENFINNIDIGLLMETFDSIVTTTKQYKPIIKELAPFISKIKNKFIK